MPDPSLAVLTGDIVGSSRLGEEALGRLMAALAEASADAAAWTGAEARFTRHRGDGWQCLAAAPDLALRTALYLRAHLRALGRGLDSRISIGIGRGRVQGTTLAAASGPAFEASGRGLDAMPRAARLAIAWAEPPVEARALVAVVTLADELSRRWTPRQAQILAAALAPGRGSQESFGAARGITQQMVAKHLRAGGERGLEAALAAFEVEAEAVVTTS